MELQAEPLKNEITKVTLAGRMDLAGMQEIERRLSEFTAAPKARILVDLSQVSFLASFGVRALVVNAREIKRHGGHMVLFNPQPLVDKVLKLTGIDAIIPVYYELDAALEVLKIPMATT